MAAHLRCSLLLKFWISVSEKLPSASRMRNSKPLTTPLKLRLNGAPVCQLMRQVVRTASRAITDCCSSLSTRTQGVALGCYGGAPSVLVAARVFDFSFEETTPLKL